MFLMLKRPPNHRDMAQSVKYLSCKNEDLSSGPQHLHKTRHSIMPLYPSAWHVETGNSLELTVHLSPVSFRFSEEPCLKTEGKELSVVAYVFKPRGSGSLTSLRPTGFYNEL